MVPTAFHRSWIFRNHPEIGPTLFLTVWAPTKNGATWLVLMNCRRLANSTRNWVRSTKRISPKFICRGTKATKHELQALTRRTWTSLLPEKKKCSKMTSKNCSTEPLTSGAWKKDKRERDSPISRWFPNRKVSTLLSLQPPSCCRPSWS